jgi:hypothetical protein
MNKDKSNWIIALLIINIIIMFSFKFAIVSKVEEESSYVRNKVDNLERNIDRIDYRIVNEVEKILIEEKSLITDSEYSYGVINEENNLIEVKFDLELEEIKANESLFLVYKDKKDKNSEEIALSKIKGLHYRGEGNFDFTKNYTYDILAKSEDGSYRKYNSKTYELYLYDKFNRERIRMHGMGTGTSDRDLEIDFCFSLNDFGIEKFKIDKVYLEFRDFENKIIKKLDIKDKIRKFDSIKDVEKYECGEFDNSYGVEEVVDYGYKYEEEFGEYYYYKENFTKEDFITDDEFLDMNDIEYKLIIICKDGYKIEEYH